MKQERVPLQKHTLELYEGDFAELQSFYAELGASIIIRKLVRKHLSQLKSKIKTPDLDLEVEV